ncbi:hypothetical protein N9Y92_01855 [Chlamydiales bacterium]|nr:hypothetical protein [Chlamydiales bacterium]
MPTKNNTCLNFSDSKFYAPLNTYVSEIISDQKMTKEDYIHESNDMVSVEYLEQRDLERLKSLYSEECMEDKVQKALILLKGDHRSYLNHQESDLILEAVERVNNNPLYDLARDQTFDLVTYLKENELKDIMEISPEALSAMNALAKGYLLDRDLESAFTLYQFLSYLDHYEPVFYQGMGLTYFFKEMYQEAIPHFSFAHQLNPHLAFPLINLCECHVALSDRVKAIETYEKAKRIMVEDSAQKEMFIRQMKDLRKKIKGAK